MAKKRSDADRRARQAERLARILRVLAMIQGGGKWTAQQLAAELEVSERTIYRDLQTLSMAGLSCYFDEQAGGYRIRPGFRLPVLNVEEIRAVQTNLAITEEDSQSPAKLVDLSAEAAQKLLGNARELVALLDLLRTALRSDGGRTV